MLGELRTSQKAYVTARELAESLDMPPVEAALILHELTTEDILVADQTSRPPTYRLAPSGRGGQRE